MASHVMLSYARCGVDLSASLCCFNSLRAARLAMWMAEIRALLPKIGQRWLDSRQYKNIKTATACSWFWRCAQSME